MTPETEPTDTEPIDILLEHAAPPQPDLGAALARMAVEARREARRRPSRAAKVALGAGLAVILTGTAGVAAASGLLPWQAWAEDPDVAFSFVLPSGRTCETRILVNPTTGGGDGRQTPAPDSPHMREWLRHTDLLAGFELEKVLPAVPLNTRDSFSVRRLPDGRYERIAWSYPVAFGPEAEPLRDYTADERYERGVEFFVSEKIRQESERVGARDWSTNEQTECEPVR